MSNDRFSLDMSDKERHRKLVNMSDEDIDYSDIPELDEDFFKNAKLVKRKPATEAISIRVDSDTLEWFRNTASTNPEIRGYQTLINDVLRTYVAHQLTKEEGRGDKLKGDSCPSQFEVVSSSFEERLS